VWVTSFSSCLSCSLFTIHVSKYFQFVEKGPVGRQGTGKNSPSAVRFFFGAPFPLSFEVEPRKLFLDVLDGGALARVVGSEGRSF
jgi:hypothetical protein